jgi:hypothetical protein
MNWTAIGLIVLGGLTIADLLLFRVVFPARTAEHVILRTINALAWVSGAGLLVLGVGLLLTE